jgi:hypothetical protein
VKKEVEKAMLRAKNDFRADLLSSSLTKNPLTMELLGYFQENNINAHAFFSSEYYELILT